MNNFLATSYDYSCPGCGRTEKIIYRSMEFPIILEDFSDDRVVKEKYFCNYDCLRKWLEKNKK